MSFIKQPIFFVFVLIILAIYVFAYPAGQPNIIYTIPDCVEYHVNVTAEQPIDPGEYHLQDCVEIQHNYWECDCSGDHNIILNTWTNTINDYTFDIYYRYATPASGTGTGGTHRIIKVEIGDNQTNQTNQTKPPTQIYEETTTTISSPATTEPQATVTTQVQETTTTLETPKIPPDMPVWHIVITGGVLIVLVGAVIYLELRGPKQKD